MLQNKNFLCTSVPKIDIETKTFLKDVMIILLFQTDVIFIRLEDTSFLMQGRIKTHYKIMIWVILKINPLLFRLLTSVCKTVVVSIQPASKSSRSDSWWKFCNRQVDCPISNKSFRSLISKFFELNLISKTLKVVSHRIQQQH